MAKAEQAFPLSFGPVLPHARVAHRSPNLVVALQLNCAWRKSYLRSHPLLVEQDCQSFVVVRSGLVHGHAAACSSQVLPGTVHDRAVAPSMCALGSHKFKLGIGELLWRWTLVSTIPFQSYEPLTACFGEG